MKVIFRTDASLEIGTGHVMRCLTLANVLRNKGAECRFICREHPGNLVEHIRRNGFEAVVLPALESGAAHCNKVDEAQLGHSAWLGCDWRTDASQTKESAGVVVVDWLIVDHYALDVRWETALRSQCRKIMVIDDLADRIHDCDLLLDQNLFAEMAHRYDGKIPDKCGLMMGPDYALLQPQYAELHPRITRREGPVRRVFVYFGGADTDNVTGRTIAAFLALGRMDVVLDVVINPANPHAASIRQQAAGQAQINLHEGLPSLASLMVQADLAIGAGGATSWERCCLGLPALVVTLADNQTSTTAEQHERGLVRWLGYKDEVSQIMLAKAMRDLFDSGLPVAWSKRCWQEVDGRGTERAYCQIAMTIS